MVISSRLLWFIILYSKMEQLWVFMMCSSYILVTYHVGNNTIAVQSWQKSLSLPLVSRTSLWNLEMTCALGKRLFDAARSWSLVTVPELLMSLLNLLFQILESLIQTKVINIGIGIRVSIGINRFFIQSKLAISGVSHHSNRKN